MGTESLCSLLKCASMTFNERACTNLAVGRSRISRRAVGSAGARDQSLRSSSLLFLPLRIHSDSSCEN
eukprot:5770348-Pyramimonas_sp.AAC.1